MKRFARYWDVVSNSGNFLETTPLLWGEGSAFKGFLSFSEWVFSRAGAVHGIALDRWVGFLLDYLVDQGHERESVGEALLRDYVRGGRKVPRVLAPFVSRDEAGDRLRRRGAELGSLGKKRLKDGAIPLPKRQSRHLS